jgi:ribulose-phosphate 3-epimerase
VGESDVIDESIWIGPSILTADFLNLGQQIAIAEDSGVDFIHLDVMDGRFVPNISFGFPIVEAVRRSTNLPLDVHLMIAEPERYVSDFVSAGADTVTVQVEATVHAHRTLAAICDAGATAGIALCPGTPISAIEELVPFVGNILVMTVNPGFGGQSFIPAMLDKIVRVRSLVERINPACRLEVDGGIKPGNIKRVVTAGADTFVIGSSIFDGSEHIRENVFAVRSALDVD